MTALADRLTDLLASLHRERQHKAALESEELRLLGLAAGDGEARAEARRLRGEIKMARETIAEIERQIAATLDKMDRPDDRSERLAHRARQQEQLRERRNERNDL